MEDCGGLGGYYHLVAVATGGEVRYHDAEELREWAGDWDPEHFDRDGIKRHFDR